MKSSRESGHQGIQTCHLCGKVQCGQRLGRVKCCLCSRIFCLQQLQRKFGITAVANDPDFKCPRCTGICCCVCNCQKPPPHVHCKVYKVRQNKVKPTDPIPPTVTPSPPVQLPTIPSPTKEIQSTCVLGNNSVYIPIKKEQLPKQEIPPSIPMNTYPVVSHVEQPRPSLPPPVESTVPRNPSYNYMDPFGTSYHEDGYKNSMDLGRFDFPNSIQDPSTSWQFNNSDAPGIQNNDWLTQLNLTILDNVQQPLAIPDSSLSSLNNQTNMIPVNTSFADSLRIYFENYGDPGDYTRTAMEKQILERATQLQVKAGKCDVLFKMLDSFNQNSIHCTVTWKLVHNTNGTSITGTAFPGLYTIIKFYPSILFTLDSTTDYSDNTETSPNGKITITFLNTSTVMNIKPLCTSIALMDNCFRRISEVEVTESWPHMNQTWTAIGNIDTKRLRDMINFAEAAEKVLANAKNPCRIGVNMNLQSDRNYFEKLPLLSLILKRVVSEYDGVVFTLYRMTCKNNVVICIVEFSETRDWVNIINSYEANIVVWEYKDGVDFGDVTANNVLLDI